MQRRRHLFLLIYTVLVTTVGAQLQHSDHFRRTGPEQSWQEVASRRELTFGICGASLMIFSLANIAWARTLGFSIWMVGVSAVMLIAAISATVVLLD